MKKAITRRVFIGSTILAGTALALLPQGATSPIKIEPFKMIEAVQEVLFPKGLQAPSASEFGATAYLASVSTHPSFWAEDLRFLSHGATLLMEAEPDFLNLPSTQKDKVLRIFVSNSNRAENWVALLLFYTLEALFSDPIYGGNRQESGWKWVQHHTGQPQPQKPFGALV